MNKRRMVWLGAACSCFFTAVLLPALRFSHPYTVALRSASLILLGDAALSLVGVGVFAYSHHRRAIGVTIILIALFLATGATIYLPGFVALAFSLVLVLLAVLRLVPLGVREAG